MATGLLKKKDGFTLVEFSIILVILGLLITTVMGSIRIIANAKATSIVTDLNLFSNAFILFNTQYDALPGDWKSAGSIISGAADGNGNGLIDVENAGESFSSIEAVNAWHHLVATGFLFVPNTICKDKNSCAEFDFTGGVNLPASKIAGTGYFPVSLRDSNSKTSTYIVMGGNSYNKGILPSFPAINGKIAKLVSKKLSGNYNSSNDGEAAVMLSNKSEIGGRAEGVIDNALYIISYKIPL